MRVVVLGAGGGLGRNTIDAALEAGHEVHALMRRPPKVPLPDAVALQVADASSPESLTDVLRGMDVAIACVNPPFSRWVELFPPIAKSMVTACTRSRTRLVFPANVWVYGAGRADQRVSESAVPAPISTLGRLRLQLEKEITSSKAPWCIVRLPEFYGPFVVSLTARVFRAALSNKRAMWPGPVDQRVEFIYMPDASRAIVTAGCAEGADGEVFHVPGIETTVRHFINEVYEQSGHTPRHFSAHPWLLRAAGVFDATARGAADISHLWTQPILLDGAKYEQRFGPIPRTPLGDAVASTIAWHRATPVLDLQG